ncbi:MULTISPECIES: hypothetical protein [unclassified Streptomyces]|uniref:hypothetical protein n=1 Tax=unclassified Streptomyces TaxID=2593676 RepID=UPI0033ED0247
MERLPGSTAGEQPPAGVVGRGVHVVPAVDPAEQEFRERFGHRGRRFAEPEKGLLFGAGDVVQREADDAAERLGVKQDDAPGLRQLHDPHTDDEDDDGVQD